MYLLTGNWVVTSFQFSSVAQSCPTLCHPMNRSMPGLPVHHQLLEFTHVNVNSHVLVLTLKNYFVLFVSNLEIYKSLPYPRSLGFSPMFSSLVFTFRSRIHFKLIFYVRQESEFTFFFPHMAIPWFQLPWLK